MNAVAAPHSPRMPPNHNIPYRNVVPRRQPSPVYSLPSEYRPRSPVSSSAPSSPRSPRSFSFASPPPLDQYSRSSTPDTHSPTNASFVNILSKHGHSQFPSDGGASVPSICGAPLPSEVYECILAQLELLHTKPQSDGCTTCYMRDLYSLTLTSRVWERAARVKLYTKVTIHDCDSPAQLKKYRWKRGSRLKLLRRTLRGRKTLANLVLELRVPEVCVPKLPGKQNAILHEYLDLVASVVMVCPNLERLLGLTLPYSHEFDRLTHALSTRKNLKEHAWIIGDNPEVTERSKQQSTDLLDQCQVYLFLTYHLSWSKLETLMLHSLDSKGVLEHGVFLRMFNFLPCLQHLSVSGFDSDQFTDRTLLFLPPLRSLRLENLRGVTENGMAHFASRGEARGLISLTLIEQNITSLSIISKILASLRCLERFAISQPNTAPMLSEGGMVFQPVLASSTLKFLHWDVASPNPASALGQFDSGPVSHAMKSVNTPNAHLAQSILHAGFPLLRVIRAPLDIDPLGAIQAVCRPARNAQIMIPADRYSLPRSSHGSVSKRPLAMPGGNNLTSARIRAQTLIDMAAKDNESGMKVVVTDHSNVSSDPTTEPETNDPYGIRGQRNQTTRKPSKPAKQQALAIKVQEYTMPAFMGQIGHSTREPMGVLNPRFHLLPDIPGSDTDGGLVTWKHVLSANQTYSYMQASSSLSIITAPSPPFADDLPAPSPTSSRFNIWGSSSSNASGGTGSTNAKSGYPTPVSRPASSPTKTSHPPISNTGSNDQPPWARDTCNGSWNQGHKLGKDWWMHVEREKVGSPNSAGMVTLQRLF